MKVKLDTYDEICEKLERLDDAIETERNNLELAYGRPVKQNDYLNKLERYQSFYQGLLEDFK